MKFNGSHWVSAGNADFSAGGAIYQSLAINQDKANMNNLSDVSRKFEAFRNLDTQLDYLFMTCVNRYICLIANGCYVK